MNVYSLYVAFVWTVLLETNRNFSAPRIKWPEREVNHLPPSNSKFTFLCLLLDSLIKYSEKFTFTFCIRHGWFRSFVTYFRNFEMFSVFLSYLHGR
jgi:hypothetical protein